MDFKKLLKRKKVPDELPGLATEELTKTHERKDKTIIKNFLEKEEKQSTKKTDLKKSPPPTTESSNTSEKQEIEQGFFNELQENITEGIGNVNKLEKWYNNKFLSHDIVSDMKNYWEKQNPQTAIRILGKNFKERISEKIIELQQLEKEWQDAYFDLIEKEEEIRGEEKELKKILAEFVEICKRRVKEKKKR